MSEVRIEYSIQEEAEDGEFVEIGFGSSGTWSDIDSALHALSSEIQNEEWEVPTADTPTWAEHTAREDTLALVAAVRDAIAVAEAYRFKGKGAPDDMPDEGTEIEDRVASHFLRTIRAALGEQS